MKCARLHLQQRTKTKSKNKNPKLDDKPRRYCQKRLMDPDHEEDPRWMDVFDRFHCNMNCDPHNEAPDNVCIQQDPEEMVLTVQTLKFQGDIDQTKRPRTSFMYKKMTDGIKHRMFIKHPITDNDFSDDDRSSQLTYYYFDDYLKYLHSNDRSRPTSSKSSVFLKGYNKAKENKSTQVEFTKAEESNKPRKTEAKIKDTNKKPKRVMKDVMGDVETIENTKITYKKAGKRKSLTISRTQSPETVQVIRVDVVCNYSNSSSPNFDDNKKVDCPSDRSEANVDNVNLKNKYYFNKYTNHFANKYLLTNTIKSLDENLSGGAKVTLLCKTFKLSDRGSTSEKGLGKERKYTKTLKNTKKENKVKNKSNVNK